MARRKYTDEERAAALAMLEANGGNVMRTAKECKIPRPTLILWKQQQEEEELKASHPPVSEVPVTPKKSTAERVSELVPQAKATLSDRIDTVLHQILDVLPAKIGEANFKDATVGFGILTEKKQLLEGKPTSIEGQEISDEERRERAAALVARLKARGIGTPHPRGGDGAEALNGHS